MGQEPLPRAHLRAPPTLAAVTAPDPPRAPLPAPLARLGARHPLTVALIIVTTVVGAVVVAATVAAFAADWWWVFDVLTSFRPQLAAVALLAAVTLAALRWPRMAVLMAVALALNVWQVAPVFTRSQPPARAGSATLTIAHLNLQGHVRDGDALQAWLRTRPADVVVLLDVGSYLGNQLSHDPGGYRVAYYRLAPALTAPSSGGRVGALVDPGAMVLTTSPDVSARPAPTPGLPPSSVEIDAHIGDQAVRLLGLHTAAPTSAARHARRGTQLDAVASWLEAGTEPSIAFGDFNVTWFSPVLRHLLDDSGARSSQLGFGLEATWPVPVRPAGIAIDQSVYTGGLTAVGRRRGPSFGSEHRSLIVTYALAA